MLRPAASPETSEMTVRGLEQTFDDQGPQDRQTSFDAELFSLIKREDLRQESVLRLIPSENYASRPVREATGSILMNKYSEGYPGRRYYQGLGVIDEIERLTIRRACSVFSADHANVQPYSGSIGVLAAYLALAQPGDTIMGPSLDHGGHLSHGHRVNLSSKIFKAVQYGVSRDTETFDFAEIEKIASIHRPRIIVAGGTAFPRAMDYSKFAEIARRVGAYLVADFSHIAGLIAAHEHPQIFPFADVGVATTHKTLRGPRGAIIVCKEEHASAVDRAIFPLIQGGPHQHTQAGIAVALFEAMQPSFKTYIQEVKENTRLLGEALARAGLRLVSGGTDTHLLLTDVSSLGLTGKQAALALEEAGIIVNANMVPFDTGSALKPSGIRLGAPSVTTRGMKAREMALIAELLLRVLRSPSDKTVGAEVRAAVREMCAVFPVPDYY
jgi:glycine hydroxymethyltransferase